MGFEIIKTARTLQTTNKSVTFDGTANKGQVGAVPYFTVTGEVLVAFIVPFCTGSLTEAAATATIALGITGKTALFIAATTATLIDNGEFWMNAVDADISNGLALPAALKDIAITDNIIATVATQNVNGGSLRITCAWYPLSADGNVA